MSGETPARASGTRITLAVEGARAFYSFGLILGLVGVGMQAPAFLRAIVGLTAAMTETSVVLRTVAEDAREARSAASETRAEVRALRDDVREMVRTCVRQGGAR